MGIAIDNTDAPRLTRVRDLVEAVATAIEAWEDLTIAQQGGNVLFIEDGAGNEYKLTFTALQD